MPEQNDTNSAMGPDFDKDYWESHWQARGDGSDRQVPPNPYLVEEIGGLAAGTALDAGCGEGAEAIWLAAQGWQVTAVDISAEALLSARERAVDGIISTPVAWVEADLSLWAPTAQFDLVTTHYAHPAMPQLEFYQRISDWVAPAGTLLIVGHLQTPQAHGHHGHAHGHHGHQPPEHASVTVAAICAGLAPTEWDIITADSRVRTLDNPGGHATELHDVVVCAVRRPG